LAGADDRGRNVLALPDNRLLMTGTSIAGGASEDATAYMLTPNGQFDLSFDTDGYQTFDFGGADEEFYGAALAPNGKTVALVGYSAGGTRANDDAVIQFLPVTLQSASLSADMADRFFAVALDGQNRPHAAGFVATAGAGASADQRVAVARFASNGVLDDAFGVGGYVTLNVQAAGTGETARGIAFQSSGLIVVAGLVEDETVAGSSDVFVARFSGLGALDTTFGTNGITRIDGGAAAVAWGLDVDAQDRIVVFCSLTADGRSDRDRAIIRLTEDGDLDEDFATDGIFTVDVEGANLNDNPRSGFVQADGKIVASGYTPLATPDPLAGRNHIVLIRLNDDGSADNSFDGDGVLVYDPFPASGGMAEAYGAAAQSGSRYVTGGYGRAAASGPVDLVSFRFGSSGMPDNTWASNGLFSVEIAGGDDRARNVTSTSNDEIVFVGTGMQSVGVEDAMVVFLTEDGDYDRRFGNGAPSFYEFGGADEEFFGVAISEATHQAFVAGYSAGGVRTNDDAILLALPIP
jgi:uncharacterized delta-60 repeat protein